jgi:hypothetical protein
MVRRALAAGCLAACWTGGQPAAPSSTDAMVCALAASSHRASAELECTATNHAGYASEVCALPAVGVRETGALYLAHAAVCSSELEPHAWERLAVSLDVPRELCQPERGSCVVVVLPVRGDETPDPSSVIGLARGLEAGATAAGRERPSLRECEALVSAWSKDSAFASYWPFVHSDADEVSMVCIGLSRAVYECLHAARNADEADACAGIRPAP